MLAPKIADLQQYARTQGMAAATADVAWVLLAVGLLMLVVSLWLPSLRPRRPTGTRPAESASKGGGGRGENPMTEPGVDDTKRDSATTDADEAQTRSPSPEPIRARSKLTRLLLLAALAVTLLFGAYLGYCYRQD